MPPALTRVTLTTRQTGSALYYALEREPELREHRYRAIHRTMDTELIERSIQEEVASVQSNIQ